ncbi:MAG: substrate-binding domain-containing protein [Tannerella sp.]|nr:substrate-binding domain-containing protein [Tannerella sp.]
MKIKATIYIIVTLILLASCDRRKITRTDTETSGEAIMAADECFSPIVKEELDVFTGINVDTKVTPIYTGEKEVFDLLLTDSVRLIMAARELTESEKATIREKKLLIRSQLIARDGIALIVNRTNPDSVINFATVKKIMTGEITKWEEIKGHKGLGEIRVAFDNPNSSTLRFINEKILEGAAISPKIKALETNLEVLKFVTETPDAMGVIGVNWISNPYDTTKLTFNETIRVMAIGTTDKIDANKAYQPVPYYLNSGDYPLIRDVYLILTDLRETLPAGVVKFFAGDAGQRIILNAGLVPATRPTRVIYIKEDFN